MGDPYEILAESIVLVDTSIIPWRQTSLEEYVFPIYARAWSRTKESDTLLRAYSRVRKDPLTERNTVPGEEGVRVRSTVNKLLRVLADNRLSSDQYFLGAVTYLSASELQSQVGVLATRLGPNGIAKGRSRAELALFKRQQFSHEAEVRVIVIRGRESASEDIFRLAFDPNEVFEEITFDPRLAPFERIEREEVIRRLGYTGAVSDWNLYQRNLLQIYWDPQVTHEN
jgi:hypothetical protein